MNTNLMTAVILTVPFGLALILMVVYGIYLYRIGGCGAYHDPEGHGDQLVTDSNSSTSDSEVVVA